MQEGQPLTYLHLVCEGEFELSKTMEVDSDGDLSNIVDFKEYLPHTEHKLK